MIRYPAHEIRYQRLNFRVKLYRHDIFYIHLEFDSNKGRHKVQEGNCNAISLSLTKKLVTPVGVRTRVRLA